MERATLTIAAVEEWRPVKGFEGLYEVSNLGRVRSLDKVIVRSDGRSCIKHGRIIHLTQNKHGYFRVSLSKGHKKYKHFEVHRLIALHFVDGYQPGLVVNHKNEIKTDNRADNLEWCTYKYNLNYSDVVAWKRKPVYQYDLQGNFIAKHKCCAVVEQMFGTYQGAMAHVMYESKRGQWKNYLWSYEERTKEQWHNILKANKPSRRCVARLSDDGTEIDRYDTMKNAADKFGVSVSAILQCCKGKSNTCAGYRWRYVDN